MLDSIFIPICSPHYQTSKIPLWSFRDCLQKYTRELHHRIIADASQTLCRYFANASQKFPEASQNKNFCECSVTVLGISGKFGD